MNARSLILGVYRGHRGSEFAWGTADCLRFADACARAVTGRSPAAHLIGRYDSEMSARRLMVENDWHDMGDVAASMFDEIPVGRARDGDWVQINNDGETDGLGVVAGSQVVAYMVGGLGLVSLGRARRAFRVK